MVGVNAYLRIVLGKVFLKSLFPVVMEIDWNANPYSEAPWLCDFGQVT